MNYYKIEITPDLLLVLDYDNNILCKQDITEFDIKKKVITSEFIIAMNSLFEKNFINIKATKI